MLVTFEEMIFHFFGFDFKLYKNRKQIESNEASIISPIIDNILRLSFLRLYCKLMQIKGSTVINSLKTCSFVSSLIFLFLF